jgi:hypothetical protein
MDGRARTGFAAIAAGATVALAFTFAGASAGTKGPRPDPWAGLSDARRNAVVDQTHAQNVRYLRDFEARHGDPRSLPVIRIDTFRGVPESLGIAAAQAAVVMQGAVRGVHFTAGANGGLPQMTASVEVRSVGRGALPGSTIEVRQLGGPVAQPNGGGALVRLDSEELMFPGDGVVLLLTQTRSGVSQYRPVLGAGVYFVRNGALAGEAAARYGLVGQSLTARWGTLSSRQLSSTDLPLLASQEGSS